MLICSVSVGLYNIVQVWNFENLTNIEGECLARRIFFCTCVQRKVESSVREMFVEIFVVYCAFLSMSLNICK